MDVNVHQINVFDVNVHQGADAAVDVQMEPGPIHCIVISLTLADNDLSC